MILAIDIGGAKFSVAAFDGACMVRRETVLDWRRELRFTHCGIGFGGPVDFAGQRVVLSTHVGGWRDFDLPGFVAGLAGAVGEAGFGAGKGCSPLFYVTLSTGIGGGIYQDGRVWRGADSCGGEIGRLTIRPGGPDCLCGARGCFERMCCDLWLERDHGRSARELLEDPAFAERYVVDLALGLKAAIMLLNPARIVIGGGIAKAGDRLFVPLRAELRRQITAWSAALGDGSVLYGAMALARA
jgi:glucokinase